MANTFLHGIDVGGTKIELVSYKSDGGQNLHEIHRRRAETPTQDFSLLAQTLQTLLQEADELVQCQAQVGIGMPGVMNSQTKQHTCTNVPALNGHLVQQELSTFLKRPIVMGNDSQCFAVSEANGGSAHGLPSMFGVILGTGAGGGFCLGGKLWRGFNHAAGEWGHTCTPASAFIKHQLPHSQCSCGCYDCVELFVSGTGLATLYRFLGGIAQSAKEVVQDAEDGVALAKKTLRIHTDVLAQALASITLTLDPHAFVLGGGLSKLKHLYTDVPKAMQQYLARGLTAPPILSPKFGDAGGARGAALLCLHGEYFV